MDNDELSAVVESLRAELEAEKSARVAAENTLRDFKMAARREAVIKLFSRIGREAKDDDIAPYLDMSDVQFSAVSSTLESIKPSRPDHLFKEQAVDGEEELPAKKIDMAAIYAARTVKVS